MPHWAFIVAAEFAFAGLILLWLHRVLNPVTRLLSDLDDHVGTILVFLVMLTGCLALAQSFEPLRLLHLFLAELLLIYFPFSKLMHTFTFILSRGYTGATMGRKGVNA
jgi:nitrate reductase gamma subunit